MTDLNEDSTVVTVAFPGPAATPPTDTAAAALPAAIADQDDSDEQSDVQSSIEQRLDSFIGFNADAYLDYYQNVYRGKQGNPAAHWHWVPFLFSIPWLFIRRRYITGVAFALFPVLLDLIFPGPQTVLVTLAAICVICGFAGRPMYMTLVLRKIDEVEARRLWPVQRDEKLRRAGGVSLMGGTIGAVLWIGLAVTPLLAG